MSYYQQQQGGYGATPHPQQAGYPPPQAGFPPTQGGYPPPQGAGAPYPPAGGGAGYPQGGAAGYPQGGAAPGYPQGGAPAFPPGAPAGAAPPAGALPQYQGEMPQDDMKDDPYLQAPTPSAPTLDDMGVVPGYENIGFNAASLPPPSYDEATRGEPPERREFRNAPSITEDDAREAIAQHVSEHCCYGKAPAREMTFRDLTSSSAFHYTLETFAESRSTRWAYEPYKGQPIDGPERGPAPGPWDIQASSPALFKASKMDVEVPHTASVKPCHQCYGRGYERCYRCHGRGRLFCHSCQGTGRERVFQHGEHHHRHCQWCHGSGRKRCYTCNGFGQVTCSVCKSHGNLKCFIKLTIQWKNHEKDYIVERTALPDQLIRTVSGQVAFEEQYPRVWPINHFPDQEVNTASNSIVTEHSRAFPTERILMQRQRVRIVPVTQVLYSWKHQENASFFVYGFERKVHAPDYPQQCCCGCTIL
ncbi:protein SSUH2 homolog isoform X2 [Babylonia areolata]|uniref:protein SSUH2 homolog isoform X2 n=1 Tax=Babylonia areolata TaxID=304850 RepID=UPI003FD46891